MGTGSLDGTAGQQVPAGQADDEHLDPRSILTSIGEVVYTWDLGADTMTWGGNVKDVLGIAPSRLTTGRSFSGFVEPGSGRSPHDAIVASLGPDQGTGVSYRTRYLVRCERGRLLSIDDSGRWFAGAEGLPGLAHGVLRIERSADGSPADVQVNGGSDRARFLSRLSEEIAHARRAGRSISVLVASIAGLGTLNNEIGDEGADELIGAVSRRMLRTMRRRDLLVRYAGNRHAAVLTSCGREHIGIAADRLARAVSAAPIETSKGAAGAMVRIGGAIFPDHGHDPALLLRRAEDALTQVRDDTLTSFAIYKAEATRDSARAARSVVSNDVVSALNERRLLLARQPIADARSGEIAFEEGLLRIRRPDGSIVGAGEIVPAVERLGLVRLLDHRVLEIACDHLAGAPQSRLAINVSPLTLADPAFLEAVAAHCGARPGIAERLIVEITETAAIEDPNALRARLDCLKALGIAIGIDDFGAGHTSFRHLRGFPIDILKIDGAFIQNLNRSSDDRFFVRTLVELAQHLGIATVAEWVESAETARILTDWGVDYLQGDFVGKPVLDDVPVAEGDIKVA